MEEENVSRWTSPTAYELRGMLPVGMVIHGTGGINSLRWLQRREDNRKKKSSADYLIRRDGKRLRLTPYMMMSYHSGHARWNGYQDEDGTLNRTHFGVELEMPNDGITPPTDEQYASLAVLWVHCTLAWNWVAVDTCLHRDCALPFGRKVDPDPWSWTKFQDEVNTMFSIRQLPERMVLFRA